MVIGIGLQRKGRDMSKLKYLIDGKADEQFEKMLWCFGGGGDDDSGGGDVSDEDLDEELQQDIAAAAVQQSGGNIGNYSYAPSFNQNDDDNDTLIQATQNILDVASAAPQGQMQQYIDQETAINAATRPVQQAIANVAFPPQPVNLGTAAAAPQTNLGSTVTGLGGEVFDPNTGQIIPPLGDPYDELPPSPAEVFRAQESQRAMGLDQRQAGYDAYQAMLNDAVGAAQSNIDNASGFLGGATKFMNQKFIDGMNTRIGGRDSEAYQSYLNDPNLFSPVYNAGGRLTGYRDEFGRLTGTDPLNQTFGNDDGDNDTVPPVTNPMTGTEQCPDGYVFDDDLQACRRKTKRELQADNGTGGGSSTASGDMFYRRTSLDDAPANLPGGFNFADANRSFTQSYAFRPSFYRNPMDTTGFTKLL